MLPWLLAANVGVLLLLLLLLAEDTPAAAQRTTTTKGLVQPMQPMPPGQLAYLRLPGADIGMREWMHCGCGQLRHKHLACTFAHTSNGSDIVGKGATLIATHGAFAPLHRAAVNGLFSVGVFVTVVKDPVKRLWDLYRTAREVQSSGLQEHADDARSCLSLLPLDSAVRAWDCVVLGVDSKETCLAAICPSCPLSCLDQVSNALVRQLGAREGDAAGAEAGVKMFTLAQRKLRFNFRVVGLSERAEDTYRLLKAAFPWLAFAACPLRSAVGPSKKDRPPPLLFEALQKRNALDVQLYASAHASFEKALAKLDETQAVKVADQSSMLLHVHGSSSDGQDAQKKKKKKKAAERGDGDGEKAEEAAGKRKKQQQKKKAIKKADSDGEEADSDGEEADGDGKEVDSDSEELDSHSKKVDNDGKKVVHVTIQEQDVAAFLQAHSAQKADGDGEKVEDVEADADADAKKTDRLSHRLRHKAALTAQWLTDQEASASSPHVEESDEADG